MNICVITDSKNAYSSKKFNQEALRVKNKIFFVSGKDVSFDDKKSIVIRKKIPLKKFDVVIMRSTNESLIPLNLILDYCEANGIRLLNKKFYLRYQSINKLRQQSIFKNKNIPCLKTLYGEKYSYCQLKKELSLPFVAKLANGSLGRQVFKIASKKEFDAFIRQRKKDGQLYIFQKFYKTDGDYRVFIIGKEVFGPVKRIAPRGEWRTNIQGATHERAEEKESLQKIAKEFSRKTGIEFAGIDILIDSHGKPRVIEINTMAGFKIFDEIYPEVNVAQKTICLLTKKTSSRS